MVTENGYRQISNIEEDCKEGLLFCGWTTKWGLKVYSWYDKDLIKFSFIEKGKRGKGKSFDISIPAKKNYIFDFMDFSHEILHDIRTPYDFITVMKQEKKDGEKYPKRYKFISGSDGEKFLGFCNSSVEGREYCLNASAIKDGAKIVANIPMSYYDIYELIEAFVDTYKERVETLKKIRMDGIAARESNIKAATTAQDVRGLEVTTTSEMEPQQDGEYLMRAVTKDQKEIAIRITQKAIEQMTLNRADCFQQFKQRVAEKPTDFKFSGKIIKRDGKIEYLFEQFEREK